MSYPAHSPNEQAARWDARLRSPECTEAERAEFQRWLSADPSHAAIYARLSAALATLVEGRASSGAPVLSHAPFAWRRVMVGAAAAALCLIVSAALIVGLYNPSGPEIAYRTAASDRAIELADGSHIRLAPGSEVRVRFRNSRREATLVSGSARFAIVPANRPFVVSAGDRQVSGSNIVFGVGLRRENVRITLLSGKARVSCWHGLLPKVMNLAAGERMIAELGTDMARVEQIS